MQKVHDPAMNDHYRNLPDITSPIIAEILNMDQVVLDELDDRIIVLDSGKANQTDMLQAVRSIGYTASTGTFRVTFFNGTYIDIDTDIEKIAINFDYDDDPTSPYYENIIITLEDGTKKYIDLSALITEYDFQSTSTIEAVVENGVVKFNVINGSITEDKLEPNFLANCRIQVSLAEGYAEDSEAWAVGQRNGTDVSALDPTYQNNSKYYSEQSAGSASDALTTKAECEEILVEVQAAASNFHFEVDFNTGLMMYDNTSNYQFQINTVSGNLEWEVVA